MHRKQLVLSFCLCSFLFAGCSITKKAEPEHTKIEKTQERITMSITGDLLFEQGLYDSWEQYQFGTTFQRVSPYLQSDLVIGNQEVPIGGKQMGVSGIAFTFNAPEEVAQQLPDIGFNVMTLANNHSYDMGYQGAVNTLKFISEAGITPVGMFLDDMDSQYIPIIEKKGVKFAFLSYTYDTNVPFEQEHATLVKTFLNQNHEFDDAHKEMLKQDVKRAKAQADVVITAMHWGNEFTYELSDTQLEAANYLNELGVDIIIGNHPHCLQTMDTLINEETGYHTIVFYSLGNFISATADVARASEDFTNMYQIGGIVNLTVIKDLTTNQISFENSYLTPIVNQFEHGYTNFSLIPWVDYSEDLAATHYQREYSDNFNYEWIKEQLLYLFDGKIQINGIEK